MGATQPGGNIIRCGTGCGTARGVSIGCTKVPLAAPKRFRHHPCPSDLEDCPNHVCEVAPLRERGGLGGAVGLMPEGHEEECPHGSVGDTFVVFKWFVSLLDLSTDQSRAE